MRTVFRGLAIVVMGTGLGLGSLWLAAVALCPSAVMRNGIWMTDSLTGSTAAGPYSRLRIAIVGLLALNRSETIYFEAMVDENGERLTSACDYVLEGVPIDARWWSVTAYGPDNYLIRSRTEHYSVGKTSAKTRPDGSFRIVLTRDGADENGLATGDATFNLTLRLYQPSAELRATLPTARLPRIQKGACRAAAAGNA
jgi:hypothetical protein